MSLASCSAGEQQKYIRVAIIQDAVSLSLKVLGYCEISEPGEKVLARERNLRTTVTAYKDGILIGNARSQSPKILIRPDASGTVVINGRRFRGDIEVIKKENLRLVVVNHIELEDYVKGILYHEASHYWPKDALKAQAIVCRTYAVYQSQQNVARDYDVTCDIYSQVYGGRTSERYRTNEAVDESRGEILSYQGKIFPAYYHATCGGHTEDASLLWNIYLVPLKGVVCGFCKGSPHFKWHNVFSVDEIAEKLNSAGYSLKKIKDIVILGRDPSSRITDLRIICETKNTDIPAKDFRNIIGPNVIRSANFDLRLIGADVVFSGLGWGHGVGLCQWGAYFMAKQGYGYKDILKYYYPGSRIERS